MCRIPQRPPALDTLEQLDQNAPRLPKKPIPNATGEALQRLTKRARANLFSTALAKALYAEGGKLKRAYGRTLDCTGTIVQDADGSAHTHYCGSRWCMVCNRIRTAKAINLYGPILDAWGTDAYMVTLTIRNVPGYQLRSAIQEMQTAFTSCKRSIKRTHGFAFEAIRKLEVTYNPDRNDYHPHYHVVVHGHAQAIALEALWHKFSPTRTVSAAQDIRQVDEGARVEVFKYFTKLIGSNGKIDAPSLNVIFTAIKGLRTYQTVGLTLDQYADPEGEMDVRAVNGIWKRHGEHVNWIWEQDYADWIDWTTGECLTGYTPSERWREFVDSIGADPVIDTETPESVPILSHPT